MKKIVKNTKLLNVVVFILMIIGLVYYKFGVTPLPWNSDVCLTALPFFHLGYLFRQSNILEKYLFYSKYKTLLTIFFLIINVGVGYLGYVISGNTLEMYRSIYGCVPLTYISAIAGILFIVLFSNQLIIKPIQYIGENSIIYFAWHQTIMMPLVSDFYRKINIFQIVPLSLFQNAFMVILSLIIICITLTIANMVIKKTFLKFMIGK